MMRSSIHLIQILLAPFLHRGNKWTRKAARRQAPEFWLARAGFRRVRFKILRALFKHRRSFREGLTATVVAREILRVIFFPVLLAAVVVVFLVWFDRALLPTLLSYLGNTARAIPPDSILASALQALSGWVQAIAPGQSAEGAHAALLGAGAQVTGIILGLYFAAISVVAGNAYGDVPPDLRSVLIEDRVGSLYLKVVGFTGGACLFGLGMLALGYTFGGSSAVVFAFFGAASILSFITLGKRVFEFFDPAAVTRALTRDIATSVNSVAASGVLAGNESIQAHHQKVAARKLDAWEEMVFVSIGRAQSASALREIGQNAVSLLHWYSEAKLAIARRNHWFERAPEHPSYLLAGDSRLSMALRTGTWIHPEMEPDERWLEKRIGEIIQRVVVALGETGSNRPCAEVLESFYSWIARSTHQLRVRDVEMGFQLASRIGSATGWGSKGSHEGTDRDRLHGLAVLDGLARAIPDAAGSLNQRLSTLRLDQLLESASRAAVQESVPLGEFPPRLRDNIESFRLEHAVEREIEGSIRTPPWFIEHHLARLLSVDLGNTFDSLLKRAEQWLPSQANSLREEGAVEAAIMVVQRGLESVSKLETAAGYTNSRLEELKRRRVKTDGGEWPDVDPKHWEERLRVLRLTLIKELVRLTPLLSADAPTGDLPDSLGFAYTALCDATVDALRDMDAVTFELVYPALVPSAFTAHNRVKAELAENSAENVVYFSTDVMLDVIDIAGYAYLWKFSLGEVRFWDIVTGAWDVVLSRHSKPADLIGFITVGQDFHRRRLATSPRAEMRWEWKGRMQRVLEERGFALRGISSNRRPKAIAIDPIASTFIATWYSLRARDLMLSEYFLKRPEAGGMDLPWEVKILRRQARRVLDDRAAGRVEGAPTFSGGLW